MSISMWETTLAKLDEVLPGVLEELRSSDIAGRPFVVVSDPVTEKFVQFARVVKRAPGDDAKGIAQIGELAFDVPALDIYLQGIGNDPKVGTECAIKTLKKWLPDEAKLVITLESNADAVN